MAGREEFEHLSDFELHNKLIQYGLPNLPVTETTRNILIKKLTNHVNNERNQRKKQQRTSAKQSPHSARENYFEYRRPAQIEQRYSYGASSVHTNGNVSPLNHTLPSAGVQGYSMGHSGHSSSRVTNNLHEPLYGDKNVYMKRNIMGSVGLMSPPTRSVPQQQQRSPKMYAPPPILSSESDEESDYLNYSTVSSPSSPASKLNAPAVRNSDQHPNPHISVVSRLLSLRDLTLGAQQQQQQQQQTPPKAPISRFFNADNNSYRQSAAKVAATNNRYTDPGNTSMWQMLMHVVRRPKQTVIPYVLLSALVLFLLVLTFMYVFISPDLLQSISEENSQYSLCSDLETRPSGDAHAIIPNCIEAERLAEVLEMNSELVRLLQTRAKQHHCNDPTLPASVSAIEFVRHLHGKGVRMDVRKVLQNVMRIEYLIARNPQWQIGILNGDRDAGATVMFPNQDMKFLLLKPKLPLSCIFKNKVQRFFLIIGTGTLIVGIASLLYFGYYFIRSWRQKRLVAVDNFIKAIEHELVQRVAEAHSGEERIVIVNHLRDKLVPLTKRNALLWSWNEALRLLEVNDSRIQFGICLRNGEEFRTMQWIGGNAGSSSSSSGSGSGSNTPTLNESTEFRDRTQRTKQWQSPAFDNVNRILHPPTPCLKIRHMFDMSEVHNPQLKQIIKDAIVYKVGPRCNITDIQIDKQTCCVYVRCASTADAGIVHNEINGWWFDKRLVSIKFLRLERYLSRFPNNNNNNINYKANTSNAYNGGNGESSGDDVD